jgi:hypothetical protein
MTRSQPPLLRASRAMDKSSVLAIQRRENEREGLPKLAFSACRAVGAAACGGRGGVWWARLRAACGGRGRGACCAAMRHATCNCRIALLCHSLAQDVAAQLSAKLRSEADLVLQRVQPERCGF